MCFASRHKFLCASRHTFLRASRHNLSVVCTKNVQRSRHNSSINLHKIVHRSANNRTHHHMPKSTIFTSTMCMHSCLQMLLYSYHIYLLFYLSRCTSDRVAAERILLYLRMLAVRVAKGLSVWIMNKIINNMIIVYYLPF